MNLHKTISMPLSDNPDPRMPRLTQVPAFVEAVSGNWGPVDRRPAITPEASAAAQAHRDRLRAELPGATIVVAAGRAPVRNNDVFYDFRAHSDFLWLTGVEYEGAVIEVTPDSATLYIDPPARPGEEGFYGDAAHGELWVGPKPGLAELTEALGVTTRPLADFTAPAGALIGGADQPDLGPASASLASTLARLRMIKDDWEIAQMRAAVRATEEGFAAVVGELSRAMAEGGERWLQGTFDRIARLRGRGPGYATIVGSGPRAAILHWVRADGQVRDGDLLLLDMGVELETGYTADVTRTLPTGGAFSSAQREVYNLVEASHRAGLAAVHPGKPWGDFHAASMEVLARGLHDWGILGVSVDEALSPTGQQHRRYIVCGVGHHLGLDVHDCATAQYADYQGAVLDPRMVLTVEPGLYFHANDETLPPELRGMGVRIEDDVLVTETGMEVLSDGIPIDAAGIEQWMANHR